MSDSITDRWIPSGNPLEEKYQEVLEDALNGKHSGNADNCELQDAVARIVATEIRLNPNLFKLDSDPAIFQRIGFQVAQLVEREFTDCARFYAEAA